MRWKRRFNKLLNKIVSFGFKRTFFVHETKDGYKLAKVYGIYKNRNEAIDDMINVSTHKKSEYELLKKYNKQSYK